MEETPAEAPAPYRPLVRRREGKMVAGVASGLADHFGVDPIVFRAGFLILAFAGGIGVFFYLLGWLMIPPAGVEGSRDRPPSRLLGRVRGRPSWVGVILLVAGAAIVARRLGIWHLAVFWGVALLVMGVVLFREDRGLSSAPVEGAPLSSPPAAPAPALPQSPTGLRRWPFGPRSGAPSPPPRAPRQRSALGWLTLGVVLLALGVAAGLAQTGLIHFELVQFLALALAVVGVGLLTGAWRGRARWLILLGLLLVPLVGGASLIDVPITGGLGTRYVSPASVGEIHRTYRLSAGQLVVDLSALDLGGGTVEIDAAVAVGRISLLAPEGATIEVRAHTGAGEVVLLGLSESGLRLDVDRTFPAPPPSRNVAGSSRKGTGGTPTPRGGGGTLVLILKTGVGQIWVNRVVEA